MSQPKSLNRRGTNYEKAQDFEIWQVARAATAANYFFRPMETKDHTTQETMLLTDAGMGLNNPTKLARNEIESLHGRGSTDVIVSVGTAKGTKPKKPTFFSIKAKRDIGKGVDELTNAEGVHKNMTETHSETQGSKQHFEYHRFNNPGGLVTEFDEWQPRKSKRGEASGSKTIEAIRHDVNAYLNNKVVRTDIENCAAKLVERRQRRSRTREWEHYATVAKYRCCWPGCYLEDIRSDKDFRNHLRWKHPESNAADLRRQVDECRTRWQYQQSNGGRS